MLPRFFSSQVKMTRSFNVYANASFREWTPPNTTSIEEHVRSKPMPLHREDSFGEYYNSVELCRKVSSFTSSSAFEEKVMTSFAGEQVPSFRPKRQLSFASYAGEQMNLWNEEFQFTNGASPWSSSSANRRETTLENNIWMYRKKNVNNVNSSYSSVASYNTSAVSMDDPWDTPRCTVP